MGIIARFNGCNLGFKFEVSEEVFILVLGGEAGICEVAINVAPFFETSIIE